MIRGRLLNQVASLALSVVVFALCLAAGEMLIRWLDGYRVVSVKLDRVSAPQSIKVIPADPFVASLPVAEGMKRDWFQLSPEPVAGTAKVNPGLNSVAPLFAAAGVPLEAAHIFNSKFAEQAFCKDGYLKQIPGIAFLFDPSDASARPRYRFPRNTITFMNLRTNQFGWRSPPIELAKPPQTIRIAFVGASTTVNTHAYPFSYPELAGYWLNKWADELNLGVKIELINAGREGIVSTDIAVIVAQEVLPLEPDLVVYYEGSNQFSPRALEKFGVVPAAGRAVMGVRQRIAAFALNIAPYSATATRIADALSYGPGDVAEAQKPDYEVVWPKDVNEFDPPLQHPRLPSELTTILKDLEDIRTRLSKDGGELVVSSFFWLVYDGMTLNLPRQKFLFDYLNTTFFPHRYREMERMAAFQNRVFQKYAEVHNLPFIDVASSLPREPDLYDDAIHAKYEGVKLHAWIAAQKLAPILLKRIKENALPRPARLMRDKHPAFPGNERTVAFDCSGGSFNVKRTWDGIVAPQLQ